MKRIVILSAFFFFLVSCNSSDKTPSASTKPSAGQQSLESFADSLVRLDQYALESISMAAGYYHRLVPADTILADSAAVMLLRHASVIVDSVNQKIYSDTTDYFELVYNQNQQVTEAQKRFQQNLMKHHLVLQEDGEGGVYATLDYHWINNILQNKTSSAVDQYLDLLAKEEKNPTLLDAGLAIEVNELVNRLIASEKLVQQNLPYSFMEDVRRKNKFYTGSLMFGSDNSPALEYNENRFVVEFQKGYDYLLKTYPNSKAAQLIKEWQAIVKSKDSRKIEEWRSLYNPYE